MPPQSCGNPAAVFQSRVNILADRAALFTNLQPMSWHWRLEDPAGATLDPASVGVEPPESDNQGDAESWLGENWRDLLARGVATVTLFEGEEKVYGPMGLAPT